MHPVMWPPMITESFLSRLRLSPPLTQQFCKSEIELRMRNLASSYYLDHPPGYGLWLARNAVIQFGGDLKITTRTIADGEKVAEFVVSLTFPRALPEGTMQQVENSPG